MHWPPGEAGGETRGQCGSAMPRNLAGEISACGTAGSGLALSQVKMQRWPPGEAGGAANRTDGPIGERAGTLGSVARVALVGAAEIRGQFTELPVSPAAGGPHAPDASERFVGVFKRETDLERNSTFAQPAPPKGCSRWPFQRAAVARPIIRLAEPAAAVFTPPPLVGNRHARKVPSAHVELARSRSDLWGRLGPESRSHGSVADS
jgi:hypothetical protein